MPVDTKTITWPVTLPGVLGMGQVGPSQREFKIEDTKTIQQLLPSGNPNNPYDVTASSDKTMRNPGLQRKCLYGNQSVVGQYHRSSKVGIWIGSDLNHGGEPATTAWKNFMKHFGITVGISTGKIPVLIDFYLDIIVIRLR